MHAIRKGLGDNRQRPTGRTCLGSVPLALVWAARTTLPLTAIAVGGVLYGTLVERHHLRVRRLTLVVPGLPESFDGYHIVQLSDFHIGGRGWSAATIERAVAIAQDERGDLLVLTGDFVETTPGIARCIAAFRPLRAPDGLVAVLGNHDYADDGVRVGSLVAALRAAGITVLRNQAWRLERGGQELWLVGVDDPYSGHDFLPAAMAGVPAGSRPIMLVHYPDFAWRLRPDRWALVLAGHAHGSQVRLPIIGRYARHRIARTRFSHGLYRINRTPVYVTTGIGTSGRPIRLRARPEVVSIRLRAGRPSALAPRSA